MVSVVPCLHPLLQGPYPCLSASLPPCSPTSVTPKDKGQVCFASLTSLGSSTVPVITQ